MYGQRCGALIGVTSDEKQILEFINVNKITSRACWSNCNRGAMDTLDTIYSDEHLLDQIQQLLPAVPFLRGKRDHRHLLRQFKDGPDLPQISLDLTFP